MEVSLKDLIAPQFYSIHWDILEGKHNHYKLYGGRGSTKSSFVSIEIIYGMMQDPKANAACFRKVKDTLAESVFEQLLWAIDALEVSHLWKVTLSSMLLRNTLSGSSVNRSGMTIDFSFAPANAPMASSWTSSGIWKVSAVKYAG